MDRAPADAASAIEREFLSLADWSERTRHLIALGRALPEMDLALRTAANRVTGCQSQVWLASVYDPETGLVEFRAYSDAVTVRGILALLLRLYSRRPPEDILRYEADVLGRIGLDTYLAPGRSTGIARMLERLKHLARECVGSG